MPRDRLAASPIWVGEVVSAGGGVTMDVSNCRHLIEDLLSQYVDGELDAKTSQRLELHMQMCPPCAAFLRTFLATKRCARTAVVKQMDESCEASLWDFLEKETKGEVDGAHVCHARHKKA